MAYTTVNVYDIEPLVNRAAARAKLTGDPQPHVEGVAALVALSSAIGKPAMTITLTGEEAAALLQFGTAS